MTVLLAEDDAVSRRMVEGLLRRWGYEVISVSDGQQAWDVLQSEDAPRLAILDWMMPGLDGIEVVKRLRARDPLEYTYVLLLTARDQERDSIIGLEAGSDDYLSKPVSADGLRARLHVGSRVLRLHQQLLSAFQSCHFQATHDSLTGLENRSAISEALNQELARSSRTGRPMSIILADVDNFKRVNDDYGHAIGDAVLCEIAKRISKCMRAYDRVSRYGGEEFLIVVPETDALEAVEIAERARRLVMDSPVEQDLKISISISLGVATYEGAVDADKLIRDADQALYSAKRGGKNTVVLAQPSPELRTATATGASLQTSKPVQ